MSRHRETCLKVKQSNHFCRGEAIIITYSVYVSVALRIFARKALAPYFILICRLIVSLYHIFPHYLIIDKISKEKVFKRDVRVLILLHLCLKNFSL